MIKDLTPLIGKLANFAQKKMGFKLPPKLFLKRDSENAKSHLGRTAHYDPVEKSITIFTTGRHPKDILRSFAHELVHHTQNLRGDLSPEKCGEMGDKYAQENPHMRKMEEEAYLVGNMCFRDFEDGEKFNLAESKILKENKIMTNKITREYLEEMIRGILEEKNKKPDEDGDGVPDWADKKPGEDDEIEEIRVGGNASKEACPKCEKENCEGCAVEEATTHQELDGTPERENDLYEARFSKRNASLFEGLVKKWAK